MKLAIFVYSLSCGGAERVTVNLANHWAGKGWNIAVVTLSPQCDDFYELHPAVKRIALEMAGVSRNMFDGLFQNLRRVFALRRLLREIEPDVALGMMVGANVLLALAAWKLADVCAIGSERVHPPEFPLSATWQTLRRVIYGRLATVTALTSETADWLIRNTSLQQVPVIPNAVVWPLPVQVPRFAPESFCASGRLIVLAVGRIAEQKQFHLLLAAFYSLAHEHPEWDLVILGEGPERPALLARVRVAKLDARVFLPGRAGNVGEWYERADLYALSSRFEGFPNTLVEAMAHGLPAVSFDCDTGPRDIIRHGVDGLLVPAGDVAALAAALGRLMEDAALRGRLAERAPEVRDRFSMPRIANMWEELFDKVCN